MTFTQLDLSASDCADFVSSERDGMERPRGNQLIHQVSRDDPRSSSRHLIIRILGREAHDALSAIPTLDLKPVHTQERALSVICLAVVPAENIEATEEAMCMDSESYALRVIFYRGDAGPRPPSIRASVVKLPDEVSADAALLMIVSPFLGYSEICVDFYDYMQVFRPGFGVVSNSYPSTFAPTDLIGGSCPHAVWLCGYGIELTLDAWDSFVSLESEGFGGDVEVRACNAVVDLERTKFLTCRLFHTTPCEKTQIR